MRFEYQLINFILLALLLWLVGRKSVKSIFVKRRQRIEDELTAMQDGHQQAEQLSEQLKELAATSQEKLAAVEQTGQERLLKRQQELEAASQRDVLEREKRLNDSLNNARQFMLNRVKRSVVGLAGELAPLQLNIGPDYTKGRLDKVLPKLAPTQADRMLVRGGGKLPVELRTAQELSDEDLLRVADALRAAYPDARWPEGAFVSQVIDHDLMGGLKLTIHDTVYDGTLKTVLETLASGAMLEPSRANETTDDIRNSLYDAIEKLEPDINIYQMGTVLSVSDGICIVSGLSDALYGEMLLFPGDIRGMVMNLERDRIGCAVFSGFERIEVGDQVRRTGTVLEVPVGEGLLGRVVDGLGHPIDGLGELSVKDQAPIEYPAPTIIERRGVKVPLLTGIKAVDALVPIGRGQRELIIGDRQTGKTAMGIDAILNQHDQDVICIYVAIGQKQTTVASVAQVLRDHDAMRYTIIVCADAFHSAPMQYIAPYTATAMGDYFMRRGRDVLIVYDDLSKHAVAYRELSLLLHRPSGREAYPGDVFYLHARLLERSARLTEEAGGGSMTALPIIETYEGDISAYIPTNVISITDGQIFLESDLFNQGQRPAVNVGLSVSRVGGSAQTGPMRQVAGRLRMELAQYRELASFAQFGADLDTSTKATLARGDRMMAALRQAQYKPIPLAHQVLQLQILTQGLADSIDPSEIPAFCEQMIDDFDHRYPALMKRLGERDRLTDDELNELNAALTDTCEALQ
jgi:F-type H+-transporting ATPase subunit alpha